MYVEIRMHISPAQFYNAKMMLFFTGNDEQVILHDVERWVKTHITVEPL